MNGRWKCLLFGTNPPVNSIPYLLACNLNKNYIATGENLPPSPPNKQNDNKNIDTSVTFCLLSTQLL